MKILIRCVMVVSVVWVALLLTDYGVLTSSEKNAAGLGLKCQYLTGRGLINAQYLHSENGLIGKQRCPLFRKSGDVFES